MVVVVINLNSDVNIKLLLSKSIFFYTIKKPSNKNVLESIHSKINKKILTTLFQKLRKNQLLNVHFTALKINNSIYFNRINLWKNMTFLS